MKECNEHTFRRVYSVIKSSNNNNGDDDVDDEKKMNSHFVSYLLDSFLNNSVKIYLSHILKDLLITFDVYKHTHEQRTHMLFRRVMIDASAVSKWKI